MRATRSARGAPLPWSAARRYHRADSVLSCSTPQPPAYNEAMQSCPFGVILFGAKPAPSCSLGEVLLQDVAARVRTVQGALSLGEPLFGRPAIPGERLGAVSFEVAEARRVHESQIELELRIPAFGGAGELFHAFGVVREDRAHG